MGFKKHNWVKYGYQNTLIVEISLSDSDRRGKVDFFKCNNNNDFKRILSILREKYGLG